MKQLHLTLLLASITLAAGGAMAQTHWDWQLSEPYDLSRNVQVMDIDPDNHSASEIRSLTARGVKTICYVSVGTVENYRDDYNTFPASVIGKTYGDWPDEKFLDIRQIDVLLPIMTARFQRCSDMGFDAVEPDNMDVYLNDSGFQITAAETITYLKLLADIAHGMNMEIGQKNVPELTPQLVETMDFAIAEGCYIDAWCRYLAPYQEAGKNVYAAEYTDTDVTLEEACYYIENINKYYTDGVFFSNGGTISLILKDRDLTSALETC